MAMTLGSVSINNNGDVTAKTGVIGRCYDKIEATVTAAIAGGIPSGSAGAKIKQAIAAQATNMGGAIYEILTLDAEAKIGSAVGGLQKVDNVATEAPGANKFLPIV